MVAINSSYRYRAQLEALGGESAQQRLVNSRVLIVGAGGLGAPLAAYLAGAGVGCLGVVDYDKVELTNLHRQVMYCEADVGLLKVNVLRKFLLGRNSTINVLTYPQRITSKNLHYLCSSYDVIVDAADSYAVTYLLSDYCLHANKFLVSASVAGQQGYCGVFCGSQPSYRAVFPWPQASAASCSETGVSGPAVGMIAMLQAQRVLDVLTGCNPEQVQRLTAFDLVSGYYSSITTEGALEPDLQFSFELLELGDIEPSDAVVDVRTLAEQQQKPIASVLAYGLAHVVFSSINALAEYLKDNPGYLERRRIVMCCKSGRRAFQQMLAASGSDALAASRWAICGF